MKQSMVRRKVAEEEVPNEKSHKNQQAYQMRPDAACFIVHDESAGKRIPERHLLPVVMTDEGTEAPRRRLLR